MFVTLTWTKYFGYVVAYEWEEYNEKNGTWQQRKQWLFKDKDEAIAKVSDLVDVIKFKAREKEQEQICLT